MLYSGFNTLPRSVVRLADSGVRWDNADVMSLDETRIFSGFKMKTTLHFVAIAFSTLLTCASAIAQTGAPPLSTETEVAVERVAHRETNGGAVIPNGHKCTSKIPSALAKELERIVGFECDTVGVTTSLTDEKMHFKNPVMLGDSFSRKGIIKTREIDLQHDYSIQFKRIFEFANADSFVSEGAFRFQNNLTQTERYLICRTRVARDKKGRLVGTTEWIGPISYENVAATTASLPKLFTPNTTAEK